MMAAQRLSTSWRLAGLLDGVVEVPDTLDVAVSGLVADSRETLPGQIFVARRGATTDGVRFLDDAVAAGAVALVREGEPGCRRRRDGVVEVQVPDVVACTGLLASRFFDHPSRNLEVIGITGTNGKTSVAHFIAQAIHMAAAGAEGEKVCGVLGTLGHGLHGALRPSRLTTPGRNRGARAACGVARLRRAQGCHGSVLPCPRSRARRMRRVRRCRVHQPQP